MGRAPRQIPHNKWGDSEACLAKRKRPTETSTDKGGMRRLALPLPANEMRVKKWYASLNKSHITNERGPEIRTSKSFLSMPNSRNVIKDRKKGVQGVSQPV